MQLPGQPSGVSQTSFIFASVFVAYLVYITLRGDLGKWLGVFGFGAGGGAPSGTSGVTGSGTGTNTAPAVGSPSTSTFGDWLHSMGFGNVQSSTNPSFDSLQAIDTGYTGPTYIDTISTF